MKKLWSELSQKEQTNFLLKAVRTVSQIQYKRLKTSVYEVAPFDRATRAPFAKAPSLLACFSLSRFAPPFSLRLSTTKS